MNTRYTLGLIKPHAVAAGQVGAVIAKIEEGGFQLKGLCLTRLSLEEAGLFYAVHRQRPFYADLCVGLASGPLVALALEKEGAIAHFRQLIGATDPAQAAPGTLRHLFGRSIEQNVVHGSDAPDTAATELAFFFTRRGW